MENKTKTCIDPVFTLKTSNSANTVNVYIHYKREKKHIKIMIKMRDFSQ